MTIPVYLVGTKEYVRVEASVTTEGVELEGQAVSIHVNGTEHPASWYGDIGATRRCKTDSVVDFSVFEVGVYSVELDLTDSPEIPLLAAGYISVQAPGS